MGLLVKIWDFLPYGTICLNVRIFSYRTCVSVSYGTLISHVGLLSKMLSYGTLYMDIYPLTLWDYCPVYNVGLFLLSLMGPLSKDGTIWDFVHGRIFLNIIGLLSNVLYGTIFNTLSYRTLRNFIFLGLLVQI